MSCEQNTIAYEAAGDRFWELVCDDYDFRLLIYEHFLESWDQFLEKENGRLDDDAYMNAFDYVWRWDCEGMHYDIKDCVNRYIEKEKKHG